MPQSAADRQIERALTAAAAGKEEARKFRPALFGEGVNPDYCLADFLLSVAKARGKDYGSERAGKNRLESVYKAALSTSQGGATGGYVVPPELRDDLMRDVSEESFVRPIATVVSMGSATLQLPWVDAETTTGTAGVPTFFGGIQMQWMPEAASEPETAEPKFRQLELRAHDLGGYALVSRPMMQDAQGLEAWLRRLFGRSIGWFEDYAFLRGTGVGQPLGVLNSNAAIKVTRTTPNKILYQDMSAMLTDLLPYSYLHAAWVCTVSGMVQVTQLVDASGKTAWVPNYPNADADAAKGNRSAGLVFNRPLYVSEKLPALGTLGDLMIFDPTLYVIGDRGEVMIDVSDHAKFLQNQSAWRVIERVDGRPLFDTKITLSDQATQVSPIVVLN